MNEIKINDELYGGATSALDISYDNSNTEATSTNLQDVIDEIWKELSLRALRDYEVVYMVDTGVGYKENVQIGSTALLPTSFTPIKEGYEFVGWRQDTIASNEILTECTVGEDPITLWAVFRKEVILTYDGNDATSGAVSTYNGYIYYNNSNISYPTVILPDIGYARTNYSARGTWGTAKKGGSTYSPGASLTVTQDTILYVQWKLVKAEGSYSFYVDNSSKSGTCNFPEAFDSVPNISLNHVYGSFGDTLGKSSVTSKSTTGFSWSVTYGGRSTCTVYWTATN